MILELFIGLAFIAFVVKVYQYSNKKEKK